MTENDGLSAAEAARAAVTRDELVAAHGALWWLESDPDQGGGKRLVRSEPSGRAVPVTPSALPVGGSLHAYGGGNFAVAEDAVWFVGPGDGVFFQPVDGDPVVLEKGNGWAYGDLSLSPDGRLLAVRGNDGTDEIVAIAPDGQVEVLVGSPDFLGHPRVAGGRLAFLEWDRHRMPWDGTRLVVTGIGDSPSAACRIAGGPAESVVQPVWGPDGELYFLSDRTGWWNLYRHRAAGAVEAVAPIEADCAPAPWEGGYRSYALSPAGDTVLTATDGITTELLVVDGAGQVSRIGANLSSVKPYVALLDDAVAVIGSTPTSAPAIWTADLDSRSGAVALPASAAEPLTGPRSGPPPVVRSVPGADGQVRYLLHLPEADGPVPVLVRAHPGPTDGVPLRLDWSVQYFVSHGFAVAEPLYRGSTGRGRAFRQQLDGRWGELDVDDCAAVAEHLVAQGVARPDALFLSGASAGGYTTLQAACRPGPFAAATAISAIIDPARWEQSVPAWQRPHAVALRGPAGAVRPERIRCPVLVIHGSKDTITSGEDAMEFGRALAARGAGEVLLLDGGDHYLSDPRHRAAALAAELGFYRTAVLGLIR
ncbi:S9 family peptidase [Kitasatospora cineracea]|uniref:Dipeptidyl aminopeptidase/acylaminoacyl peptidase n=1 Tax=Kitasatospora cineracea TaxID=88074 RepID=A0A8G1UM51_9ACTN|nr:prolyl oligopeptidase family serine peptidase [Kitasatospora cineracea]ROR46486.1 dipeptidyl aminopeptidase/acylaminoacyl peptidase [Kitasatospora cineracea]